MGKKHLTTKGNNVLQGQLEVLYFWCSSSTWEGVSQKHMLKTVLTLIYTLLQKVMGGTIKCTPVQQYAIVIGHLLLSSCGDKFSFLLITIVKTA